MQAVKAKKIAWRRLPGRKHRRCNVDVTEARIARTKRSNFCIGFLLSGPIRPSQARGFDRKEVDADIRHGRLHSGHERPEVARHILRGLSCSLLKIVVTSVENDRTWTILDDCAIHGMNHVGQLRTARTAI